MADKKDNQKDGISLSVEPELKMRLMNLAKISGKSFNKFCAQILQNFVDEHADHFDRLAKIDAERTQILNTLNLKDDD